MSDYSEEEKKEIDRQLRSMRRHVVNAQIGSGLHLFPSLKERSDEIQSALWAAIGVIDKLRMEIGYIEPPEPIFQVMMPPTALPSNTLETGVQRPIALLRVMLILKSDISDENRAAVLQHLLTPPNPTIDPMGTPLKEAFTYALAYQRDDDAKRILEALEALSGVESASIIFSTF